MKEQHFSNSQLATPPASPLPEGVEEALESRQEEFEQEEVEYEQHEYEQENHEEEGNEGEGENDEEEAYEEEYEEREEEKGLYNWGDVLELVQPGEYYSGYRRMLSYMLQLGCTIRVKYGRDEKTLGCDDYREQVRQRRREEREFTRQWRRQERDFERLPQPPRSQPPPPLVQEYQPALYYYNHTQYCDSPDEPVWDRTEPVTMFVEEQEEDRRWMECRRETLQDMNQKVEFELMHYVALAEKQPQYPQEPLRVSMFHVGSGHLSTSLPGGHGEVSSSSGSQNLPPTAYISDSDKSFPWSDDEEEAEDSAREQGKMSSIERSLRAQAVTALHNPSAMLLHSVFMNEVCCFLLLCSLRPAALSFFLVNHGLFRDLKLCHA